jgi:lipopolysaccharide transport system ATP-binding protein
MTNASEQIVINAKQISKCYQTYQKPIDRLWQNLRPSKKYYQEYWALHGVDLTVRKGESLAIIGRNGSGKSTFLQIITGILQPTGGTFETNGRISALLELGAGFNPEFTGMENARLNASVMGLSRDEFHEKLPDIVEFCGLGEFLHRPVKTYSSGMFVRLAFAVAINMNPDILIIDEALAVGDVRFQTRCFRRLEELKEQGVSILMVTHSTDAVIKYCDRAVMLEDGRIKSEGAPKKVVHDYLEMMFSTTSDMSDEGNEKSVEILGGDSNVQTASQNGGKCETQPSYNPNEHRWGDRRALITHYELFDGSGDVCAGMLSSGDKLTIKMRVEAFSDISKVIYGVTVKSGDGKNIYGTNTRLRESKTDGLTEGDIVEVTFSLTFNLLGGDYFISLGVAEDDPVKDNLAIDRRYDLIHINLTPTIEEFGIAAMDGQIAIDSYVETKA